MRGRRDPQVSMLAFIDMEARVRLDHPLRTIKALPDASGRWRSCRPSSTGCTPRSAGRPFPLSGS